MKAIEDYPTLTFFKEKLIVYAKIFPSIQHIQLTTKIIFQLEVDDLISKFYPLRADSLSITLLSAKLQDELSSN